MDGSESMGPTHRRTYSTPLSQWRLSQLLMPTTSCRGKSRRSCPSSTNQLGVAKEDQRLLPELQRVRCLLSNGIVASAVST